MLASTIAVALTSVALWWAARFDVHLQDAYREGLLHTSDSEGSARDA